MTCFISSNQSDLTSVSFTTLQSDSTSVSFALFNLRTFVCRLFGYGAVQGRLKKRRCRKSKKLRLFWPYLQPTAAVFTVFFATQMGEIAAEESRGKICNYSFPLPEKSRLLKEEPNLIQFKSEHRAGGKNITVEWLFSCSNNYNKTNRISELETEAEKRQEKIGNFEELSIAHGIRAALYLRTRMNKGRRRANLEAYFATKEREYRLYSFPSLRHSNSDGDPKRKKREKGLLKLNGQEIIKTVRRQMKEILQRGNFIREVKTTITEAEYRLRLYLTVAIALPLFVLLLWGLSRLFRKYFRKLVPPRNSSRP